MALSALRSSRITITPAKLRWNALSSWICGVPNKGAQRFILFIAAVLVIPDSIVGVEIKSRNDHSCLASFARHPA